MIELSQQQHTYILDTLKEYLPAPCEVHAFGSRTKGRARNTSDLDLLITSPTKLAPSIMAELSETFADSELPFKIDLLERHDISQDFFEHIQSDLVILLD